MFKFSCPPELWSLGAFPDAASWPDLGHEEAVLLNFPHLNLNHSVHLIIVSALSEL